MENGLQTLCQNIGASIVPIEVIGAVFGCYILVVSRNPKLEKKKLFSYKILGFAVSEAIALFSLMMAFLILFA